MRLIHLSKELRLSRKMNNTRKRIVVTIKIIINNSEVGWSRFFSKEGGDGENDRRKIPLFLIDGSNKQ